MPHPVNDLNETQFRDAKSTGYATSQPALTFGQQLVGLTFNPSGDDKVTKAKQLCADLMDLVNEEFIGKETTILKNILYNQTVGRILDAQMNVVKLLTLKY